MITYLKYGVTFGTGRIITRDLEIEPAGSTLITGRNEAGKSLNLEMIGFLLFGSVALRGKASDYKRMTVEGGFILRGRRHRIRRTKSKADIWEVLEDGERQLATGTAPVNDAVVKLLGYGYSVYQIAHLAAQGDLQALANMKPAERKAMVDQVSGLVQLDGLLGYLDGERSLRRQEIATTEQLLKEPEAPATPDTDATLAEHELDRVAEQMGRRQQLEWETQKKPVAPQAPQKMQPLALPPKPEPELLPPEPEAEALPPEPVAPVRPEFLDDGWEVSYLNLKQLAQDNLDFQRQLDAVNIAPPMLTLKRCAELERQWEDYQLSQEKAKLQAKGAVTCEACGHETPLAAEALKDYAHVPDDVPKPEYGRQQIASMHAAWERYEADKIHAMKLRKAIKINATFLEILPEMEQYAAASQQYDREFESWNILCARIKQQNARMMQQWTTAVQQAGQRNIQAERTYKAQCEQVEAHNAGIESNYQQALRLYQKAQQAYQQDLETWQQAALELSELPEQGELAQRKQAAEHIIQSWRIYFARFTDYQRAKKAYDEKAADLEVKRQELQQYDRAKRALQEVKVRVKSYLTPAISRVASYLLAEMTGGERAQVEIDEGFEVIVDGQPLRTLSGSGKDIVNLAIRLALGQVLTHRVMGMFLADEVDQGCDDNRARYIQECLQRITPKIGQLLIVSHKPVAADHRIAL